MQELEDDQTLLICTPGKKSKLSTSLTVFMQNAISKGLPMLMISLPTVFLSSYGKLLAGAWTTLLLIFETNGRNMEDFDTEPPALMTSYGLLMTKDMTSFGQLPMGYCFAICLHETREDQNLQSRLRL